MVGNATDYLRNVAAAAERSYTFLHVDLLDARGHGNGWCEQEYLDGVDIVDQWVGDLLDAIDDEDGEEWLVGGDSFLLKCVILCCTCYAILYCTCYAILYNDNYVVLFCHLL